MMTSHGAMLGDKQVTLPSCEATLGVTINAAPAAIWSWLLMRLRSLVSASAVPALAQPRADAAVPSRVANHARHRACGISGDADMLLRIKRRAEATARVERRVT